MVKGCYYSQISLLSVKGCYYSQRILLVVQSKDVSIVKGCWYSLRTLVQSEVAQSCPRQHSPVKACLVLYLGKNKYHCLPGVILAKYIVQSQDVSLVKGHNSCQRLPSLALWRTNKYPCSPGAIMAKYAAQSKDFSLVKGCQSCQRLPSLVKGASVISWTRQI